MLTKVVRLYDEVRALRKNTKLPIWAESKPDSLVGTYAEMDSILGVINFSRRKIVASIEAGNKPALDELKLLLDRAIIINDRPGFLKCALLLRKYFGIVPSKIDTYAREVEWARLMKLRWRINWICSGIRWILAIKKR